MWAIACELNPQPDLPVSGGTTAGAGATQGNQAGNGSVNLGGSLPTSAAGASSGGIGGHSTGGQSPGSSGAGESSAGESSGGENSGGESTGGESSGGARNDGGAGGESSLAAGNHG